MTDPHPWAEIPSTWGTKLIPAAAANAGPAVTMTPWHVQAYNWSGHEENSTPAEEPGTIVGHLGVPGIGTTWTTFDPRLNVLLGASGSNITEWSYANTTPYMTHRVSNGTGPLALDSGAGILYSADRYSDSVVAVNISGYGFAATSITSSTYLTDTRELAFDPADGLVYVLPFGAGFVTVINGSSILGTVSIPSLANSTGNVVYNSVDRDVYVNYDTSSQGERVAVINGTQIIGNLTLPLGGGGQPAPVATEDPIQGLLYFETTLNGTATTALAAVNATETNGTSFVKIIPVPDLGGSGYYANEYGYNPSDDSVFVPNALTGNISIVQGTHFVGNLTDVANVSGTILHLRPSQALYYPPTGAELVYDGDGLAVVSTFLSESAIGFQPASDPPFSEDVGRSFVMNTTLAGIGTGNLNVSYSTNPSGSLSCSVAYSIEGTLSVGRVQADCTPELAGDATVWMNVSDGIHSVWSRVNLSIFTAPTPSTPIAIVDNVRETAAADVNQTVRFEVNLGSTDSTVDNFTWLGISTSAQCVRLNTDDPTCQFYTVGPLNISVRVVDGNGATSMSAPLRFQIDPELVVPPPTTNTSVADVGQTIAFKVAPSGGSGIYYSVTLFGQRTANCTAGPPFQYSCQFNVTGDFSVGAMVNDSNGYAQSSETVSITIDPLPVLGVASSRASLDVGQSVQFWANDTAGSAVTTFNWLGLPLGCDGNTSGSLTCQPTIAGVYNVTATATDKNGGVSLPSSPAVVAVLPQVVATLHAQSSDIRLGAGLWINVSAEGGTGNYTFAWYGLPPGCQSFSASVRCYVENTGTFTVYATAVDENGERANAPSISLNVSGVSAPAGLSGLTLDLAVAIPITTVAALALGFVVRWMRRRIKE